jgi:hypothetical protein
MRRMGEKIGTTSIKECTKAAELLAYTFGIVGKRSYTHEAVNADKRVFLGTKNSKQGKALIGKKSMLGRFPGEMKLEQDTDHSIVFTGLPIYLTKKVERIYTVNGVDKRDDEFDFVRL